MDSLELAAELIVLGVEWTATEGGWAVLDLDSGRVEGREETQEPRRADWKEEQPALEHNFWICRPARNPAQRHRLLVCCSSALVAPKLAAQVKSAGLVLVVASSSLRSSAGEFALAKSSGHARCRRHLDQHRQCFRQLFRAWVDRLQELGHFRNPCHRCCLDPNREPLLIPSSSSWLRMLMSVAFIASYPHHKLGLPSSLSREVRS